MNMETLDQHLDPKTILCRDEVRRRLKIGEAMVVHVDDGGATIVVRVGHETWQQHYCRR